MFRIILELLILFFSPFIVYSIFIKLTKRYPQYSQYWKSNTVAYLAIIGLFLAILGVIFLADKRKQYQGGYIPATVKDGKLIPGHFQDNSHDRK